VRPTVRLKAEGDATRVVASTWASDRAFPRTEGSGVVFELETGDGAVYRVEPFDALVTLPVRATVVEGGVRREEAWIAADDEITVEGELERGGRARPPALRARRIVMNGAAAAHRLPPRTLRRGEQEKIDKVESVQKPDKLEAAAESGLKEPPAAPRGAARRAGRPPRE
jgi:hypothetical protein